jgi:hypothetical protein
MSTFDDMMKDGGWPALTTIHGDTCTVKDSAGSTVASVTAILGEVIRSRVEDESVRGGFYAYRAELQINSDDLTSVDPTYTFTIGGRTYDVERQDGDEMVRKVGGIWTVSVIYMDLVERRAGGFRG